MLLISAILYPKHGGEIRAFFIIELYLKLQGRERERRDSSFLKLHPDWPTEKRL